MSISLQSEHITILYIHHVHIIQLQYMYDRLPPFVQYNYTTMLANYMYHVHIVQLCLPTICTMYTCIPCRYTSYNNHMYHYAMCNMYTFCVLQRAWVRGYKYHMYIPQATTMHAINMYMYHSLEEPELLDCSSGRSEESLDVLFIHTVSVRTCMHTHIHVQTYIHTYMYKHTYMYTVYLHHPV